MFFIIFLSVDHCTKIITDDQYFHHSVDTIIVPIIVKTNFCSIWNCTILHHFIYAIVELGEGDYKWFQGIKPGKSVQLQVN